MIKEQDSAPDSQTLWHPGEVWKSETGRPRSQEVKPSYQQVHFTLFFLKLVITGSSHHAAWSLRFSEANSPPFPGTNNTNKNLCLYSNF